MCQSPTGCCLRRARLAAFQSTVRNVSDLAPYGRKRTEFGVDVFHFCFLCLFGKFCFERKCAMECYEIQVGEIGSRARNISRMAKLFEERAGKPFMHADVFHRVCATLGRADKLPLVVHSPAARVRPRRKKFQSVDLERSH